MSATSQADPREIGRTRPDRILYDPTGGRRRDWDDLDFLWLNEHVLVQTTKDGNLLAMWTAEHIGGGPAEDRAWLQRIACSRSHDGGHSWTPINFIDGSGINGGLEAAWQVPVVAPSGLIYVFYTYGNRGWYASGLRCRTSDDHGLSWSQPVDLPPFPKTAIDSPKEEETPVWICCSGIHVDSQGNTLLPYTRWARNESIPAGNAPIRELYCHIEIIQLENLQDSPDPVDLKLRLLNGANPVTAPHPHIDGASQAMEPYLVNLPDGRLFMVLRTNLGEAWYSVSADGGRTWRKAEPLRYRDNGEILQQPSSPCPIFALERGDYLFLFNNNDGFVFGATHVWQVPNRRPAYLARGAFRPDAWQPIWWSQPKLFVDNDAHAWGPPGRGRLEAAAYGSFTELGGERIIWYPDRKGFLVGKIISDKWLADMEVPVA